eukprot:8431869-Alexandrium_andersonii.AAC.1
MTDRPVCFRWGRIREVENRGRGESARRPGARGRTPQRLRPPRLREELERGVPGCQRGQARADR